MEKLLAVCTGHIYPQKISVVVISVRGLVDGSAAVWLEGLSRRKFLKNDNILK
jgi:hypothetical protein